MRRLHLFEIADKEWCPHSLRGTVTDYIQFGVTMWKSDIAMASLLRQALDRLGVHHVVDLCSGSGGPWLGMIKFFEDTHPPVTVCLTDKYPNIPALQYVCDHSAGNLGFSPEPVDAAKVPRALNGFRTLCAAFHHFRPPEARAILRDAANSQQGIAIFEITERTFRTILIFIGVSLIMPFCIPFFRPFRWSRLMWTYVIPVAPVVQFYDSLISCLRTYSPSELQELTKDLHKEYIWETGAIKAPHSPVPISYLLGYRQQAEFGTRKNIGDGKHMGLTAVQTGAETESGESLREYRHDMG
jgi:hypothetical protein